MAGALIGGAALGAGFGELLKVVIDLAKSAINFSSVVKQIHPKIEAMVPLVTEIDDLNADLKYPKEETEKLRNLLEKGKNLLLQCLELKRYNYLKKPNLTAKLREWNEEIGSLMDVLLLQTARDGKKSLKTMSEIKDVVHRIDSKYGLSNSVDSIVLPCLVPEIKEESVGLDEPVEKLKAKLFKDGVRLLVVTASGGCGKTTLAIRFCHDKQVKDKFQENILFLTVSSKPDTKLILKSIIQSLRGPVLSVSVVEDEAFRHLEQWVASRLGLKPVLIVLDDVWEGSESDKLLEKFSQMPNCKILVTSRFKFLRFGQPYELEPLNRKDAMKLFHRSASLNNSIPQFHDEQVVEKIVRGCKRFPLALKVIARSLSGRAPPVWKDTERKLSRGDSIFGSEKELLKCLKSSLDALSDVKMPLKEHFMDLGSFPEGQKIRVATFIDICGVLYNQNECQTMTNLDELIARNLVGSVSMSNEAYEDDHYSEANITQHDILRELAIHLTNEQQAIDQRSRLLVEIKGDEFPEWWSVKQKQPVKARLLSITTDDTRVSKLSYYDCGRERFMEVGWCLKRLFKAFVNMMTSLQETPGNFHENFSSGWPDLEAPEVEVLILNAGSKTYKLPKFMKTMKKLKALIVTNYRSFPTELTIDRQLIDCLSRLERIRLERISIPSFSNQNLKLTNLKKLSFFMCKVDKAFTNYSTRISDALPNLLEISMDFCNDLAALPIGLCEVVKLERLSITNCHGLTSLPEELGQLINLKTLRLRSCIHLEELPKSISKLLELVELDISHCLGLTKLPDKIGNLQKLEKLNMRSCPNTYRPPESIKKLTNLKRVVCEWEMAKWFNIVSPRLRNVVKEHQKEISLDWLKA